MAVKTVAGYLWGITFTCWECDREYAVLATCKECIDKVKSENIELRRKLEQMTIHRNTWRDWSSGPPPVDWLPWEVDGD